MVAESGEKQCELSAPSSIEKEKNSKTHLGMVTPAFSQAWMSAEPCSISTSFPSTSSLIIALRRADAEKARLVDAAMATADGRRNIGRMVRRVGKERNERSTSRPSLARFKRGLKVCLAVLGGSCLVVQRTSKETGRQRKPDGRQRRLTNFGDESRANQDRPDGNLLLSQSRA
jgi:hypothetical protein